MHDSQQRHFKNFSIMTCLVSFIRVDGKFLFHFVEGIQKHVFVGVKTSKYFPIKVCDYLENHLANEFF